MNLAGEGRFEVGGADEIRTRDLRRAKAALSQLSYGPSGVFCKYATGALPGQVARAA